MKNLFQLICLSLLIKSGQVRAQIADLESEFSFLFYNTENFFDCENDTTKSDEEYLANAQRNWTPKRLHLKTERLAKVILAAGKWNAPIIVGLCEIENREVLETLVKTEPLTKFRYKIVQKESHDSRGIDVALLYRPEFFYPFDYKAIPVLDPEDKSFRTRDILKVAGVMGKSDTLTVFVNHWPSRYGGIMGTQKYRNLAARILRKAIDEILAKKPDAKIVCMGDFNDTPADQSIATELGAKSVRLANDRDLLNLSSEWTSETIQTIKFRYRWEVFDQFIVSSGFEKPSTGLSFRIAEIFKGSFLLENDVQYGGMKPKRTYLGFKYHDGFSDHLPVVLRFELFDY